MKDLIRKFGTMLAAGVFMLSTSWTITTGSEQIGLTGIIESLSSSSMGEIVTLATSVIVDNGYCDRTLQSGCVNHTTCPTVGVGGAKQKCLEHSEKGKVYCDCQIPPPPTPPRTGTDAGRGGR